GGGRHRTGDPALRTPPALLVPPRSPHPLAGRGRPAGGPTGAGARAGRRIGTMRFAKGFRFAKGQGTGNDFVILPDPDAELDLTPDLVRRLCDRRFGIGGDGVLRVVRAAKHPEAAHLAGEAEWFMDYHNSDGSLSEMCGNGVRVFARYLTDTGLVTAAAFRIATRAGVVTAVVDVDEVTVDMPRPVLGPWSVARHH